MANFCINKVVITHDNKSKVRGLYHVSSGDFFNFILPPPVELCNKDTLRDKQYNLEEFGADNLSDWRLKNWGNRYPPVFGAEERKISQNGDILFLDFVTKWTPAIGIFEELERQGYRVKAYFWEPAGCYCGSFMFGTTEYLHYVEGDQDIPPDIDMFFGIEEYVRIYESEVEYDPDIMVIKLNADPYYNKVIIKHDDFSKVKGLYHIPTGYFSDFIKLYPEKLCNQEDLIDNQYNLKEMGSENLTDWINKNRSSRRPYPETIERKLSKDGSFLMLQFETPGSPPIEIYKELERQGFRVRAYFFSPYSCFCGSFIHGISEWYKTHNSRGESQDIPQDLDRMFGVYGFRKGYESEEDMESPDEFEDQKEIDHGDHSSKLVKIDGIDDMDYFKGIVN